jgi:hypothetical protein
LIEGSDTQTGVQPKSYLIEINPPRNNALDYFLILILLGCLGKAGWDFYQTRLPNEAIASYAIAAVVAFLVLNRQKKPKEKQFSCARCKTVANFDSRTIQAWNNGFLKLYCNHCHQRWLREHPVHSTRSYLEGRGRGCLLLLCIFSVAPIMAGIAIYQWII